MLGLSEQLRLTKVCFLSAGAKSLRALLRRLGRDRSGNTLMIVAGAIVPLLELLGGGIDVGRIYLIQSRLQQACDAGVLGARKELGTIANFDASTDGARVESKGDRLFNVNFADGMYRSAQRSFAMEIRNDLSVGGHATVTVPMAVMQFFGQDSVSVSVDCAARLNAPNTDVVMALDVTGSMNETNPGDSNPKIAVLKAVVKQFRATMDSVRQAGSRMRYGFVPYSTNVNVGGLLRDEWVVSTWTYPSRELVGTGGTSGTYTYNTSSRLVSGSFATTRTTSDATLNPATGAYGCSRPNNTLTGSTTLVGTTSVAVTGPPAGTRTTSTYNATYNGSTYSVALSGTTCTLTTNTYNAYTLQWDSITEPRLDATSQWHYADIARSVADWRTATAGCIEERDTYEVDDWNNVDLSRARDLDIDAVPDAGDPATQWRPAYAPLVFNRAMAWNGTGSFSVPDVTTSAEFVQPWTAGFAACPAAARKLQVWDQTGFDSYIDGLSAAGSTYHDIGMIWAGRLISPTGIFAAENADVTANRPTSRHVIFLTDGQTAPLDLSYGAYGVEPLAQRRWRPSSPLTLTQTVEKRFSFACEEVKKRNVTVWFIAFGTDLNPIMTQCAGDGHYFAAGNATELGAVFERIARSIGGLRLE